MADDSDYSDAVSTTEADLPNEIKEPKKRTFRPLKEKVALCMEVECVVTTEKRQSFKAFCREHNVDPSQLRRWRKNIVKMNRTLENTTKKANRLTCNVGRRSRMEPMKDKLLAWLQTKITAGKPISVRHTSIQAGKLDRSLRRMKRYTLFATVRRFLNANGLVTRAVTHKAQDDPIFPT